MSIPRRFPPIVASALLSLALDACSDDGAAQGTEGASSGESTTGSSTDGAVTADSGSDTSGPAIPSGACRQFPTIPAIGYVFVSEGAEAAPCNGTPEPCAGDPFGEWTLASACGAVMDTAPGSPFFDACPGGIYEPALPVHTGTLSIEPSGAFALSRTTTYDFLFSADIGCLGTFECGAEAEAIITEMTGGSASCEGEVLACVCTVTGAVLESESSAGEGATGERPLLVNDAGSIHPFCVSDGQLAVWSLLVASTYAGSCEVDDDCETTNDNQIAACLH